MKKNGSAVCEFFVFFFAHYYLEDRSAGRVVGGFTNMLVRGSNYWRKRVGALGFDEYW